MVSLLAPLNQWIQAQYKSYQQYNIISIQDENNNFDSLLVSFIETSKDDDKDNDNLKKLKNDKENNKKSVELEEKGK